MEISSDLQQARDAAMAGNIQQAIEMLERHSDAAAAVDLCDELVRDFYWKEKKIQVVIALGKAGIALALDAANRPRTTSPQAAAFRKQARILSYNVSSFCWRGWNEPGIDITPEERTLGRELALQHIDLVTRYEPQPLTLSRAHWIVGAHLLAARQYDAAEEQFSKYQTLAKEAQSEPDHLLAQGYGLLTILLQQSNPNDREHLDAVKTAFKAVDEGDEYIQQLETAEKAFSAKL